jgi:hypothetical protein
MEKREHKHAQKHVGSFPNQSKKAATPEEERLNNRNDREIHEILSPFWAWRALCR